MARQARHDLIAHRALIDACLNHGVEFWWRGPGTLLIDRGGVESVVADVEAHGFRVLGFEGFDLGDGRVIHPRLDLIADLSIRPVTPSGAAITDWPNDVWIDVALASR
jgi:hypothetical protein